MPFPRIFQPRVECRITFVFLLLFTGPPVLSAAPGEAKPVRVLVFTKTQAYRHASIPAGIAALVGMAGKEGWKVDATEDAGRFTDSGLANYDVVVWLNTTGDVLNPEQQAAYERFHRSGKGTVAIHAGGADTEKTGWPWYREMMSVAFKSHPRIQNGSLVVHDRTHPSTFLLPHRWEHVDEWYNFDGMPAGVHVLIGIDEQSYEAGKDAMTPAFGSHPLAWYRDFDGGRFFYTALGHTVEDYTEDRRFLAHVAGGIGWAAARLPNPVVIDRGGTARIFREFDGASTNGVWEKQFPPASPKFTYEVTPGFLLMHNDEPSRVNQHIVRRGVSIDPRRPYAIEGRFVIHGPLHPRQANSFAVNFNVSGQDGDAAPVSTWSLNVDLHGDGLPPGDDWSLAGLRGTRGAVIKFMGFSRGVFAEIGHIECDWGSPETTYGFRILVNASLNGRYRDRLVSATFTEGSTELEKFQVDYSAFPYQPDPSRSVRFGFNTHGAAWSVSHLNLYYLDVLRRNDP